MLGRIRSNADAMMAPFEKPTAIGGFPKPHLTRTPSVKLASSVAFLRRSTSSIDLSANLRKNANPPSQRMAPRTARIDRLGVKSCANGIKSCSLPPDPCSSTSGLAVKSSPVTSQWMWDGKCMSSEAVIQGGWCAQPVGSWEGPKDSGRPSAREAVRFGHPASPPQPLEAQLYLRGPQPGCQQPGQRACDQRRQRRGGRSPTRPGEVAYDAVEHGRERA